MIAYHSYDTEPWFPFVMVALLALIAVCAWAIGTRLAPSVHQWLISDGDERYALREKARVEFVDKTLGDALLLDAELVDGVITGRRWVGQVEEGWYTYPLHTVRQILWEPMEEDDDG